MTLLRHTARCMKGEAMDMITIHTTALGTTPPSLQHSMFCMEAQAMATTTVHTTLRGMTLTHHLVWRMKGEVMAMTTDRIIQLLTSFPPHSVLLMNSQATTLTTIRIIVLRTILLRLFVHMWPHAIGRRKSSSNSLRKRPDKVKLIIRESLRKITASIICNGTQFISSTLVRHLVRHLVRLGPPADLMRRTLTRTWSDSWLLLFLVTCASFIRKPQSIMGPENCSAIFPNFQIPYFLLGCNLQLKGSSKAPKIPNSDYSIYISSNVPMLLRSS
jgi:hypothetical protein